MYVRCPSHRAAREPRGRGRMQAWMGAWQSYARPSCASASGRVNNSERWRWLAQAIRSLCGLHLSGSRLLLVRLGALRERALLRRRRDRVSGRNGKRLVYRRRGGVRDAIMQGMYQHGMDFMATIMHRRAGAAQKRKGVKLRIENRKSHHGAQRSRTGWTLSRRR